MSTRTYMLGLESIEPIRMAIGSKTRRILDDLIVKLDKVNLILLSMPRL